MACYFCPGCHPTAPSQLINKLKTSPAKEKQASQLEPQEHRFSSDSEPKPFVESRFSFDPEVIISILEFICICKICTDTANSDKVNKHSVN